MVATQQPLLLFYGFGYNRVIMRNKLSTIIISIFVALFILAIGVACPIFIRAFYYAHIEPLELVEKTGYSEETIRGAFDEMMDYCTHGGPKGEYRFGTGELAWSEEGKAHFDDVARLFSWDLRILLISFVAILIYVVIGLINKSGINSDKGKGLGPFFWGPLGLLLVMGGMGYLVATKFDEFFVKFHEAFFPGKDNWLFNPAEDEIIKILPEVFFRNCAILIISVIFVLSIFLIVFSLVKRSKSGARKY